MPNGNESSHGPTVPKDFVTHVTFGTVAGCAVITWLVAGVLGDVFDITHGALGLVVAMVVAYARMFVGKKKERGASQMVLAFFNGFLIYATVVGGTSFMPYVNAGTAEPDAGGFRTAKVGLVEPWISDKNMVAKNQDLSQANTELDATVAVQANALEVTSHELQVLRTELESGAFDRTRALSAVGAAESTILRVREESTPARLITTHGR